MRIIATLLAASLIAFGTYAVHAQAPIVLAQGAHGPTAAPPADATSPEERMRRRFPQPVRVAALIGSRVLDDGDITLGRVRQVVRKPDGKILLIVAYGGWFGWGTRPIAVPIEVVALIGPNVAALDMTPEEFAKAANWSGQGAQPIPPQEIIKIAINRR